MPRMGLRTAKNPRLKPPPYRVSSWGFFAALYPSGVSPAQNDRANTQHNTNTIGT
jgi:hypothetical protein